MRNPYETLGVSKTANETEIKKAFRVLAQKHHPDRGGDASKFKEVNEAYQILSDSQKRKQYDQFGAAGFENGGFGGFRQGGNSGGSSGFEGFNMNFDFGGGGFEDIFSTIFDGFTGGRTRSRTSRAEADLDIHVATKMTLKETMTGIRKKFEVSRKIRCETCSGTGAKNGKTEICATCGGTGQTAKTQRTPFGVFKTVGACETCEGTGRVIKEKCEECKGDGFKRKIEVIEIEIPAGIQDGEALRVKGKGDSGKSQTGDLIIVIRVTKSENFARHGDDLVTNLEVSYSTLILGGKEKIETPNETVEIKIPEGTKTGDILKVSGKGFPKRFGKGNLLVQIEVKFPEKLTNEQKRILVEMQKSGL